MFQSLQGTIQTLRDLQIRIPVLPSFNPFKVRSKRPRWSAIHLFLVHVSIPSRYDPNSVDESREHDDDSVSIPSRYDPNRFEMYDLSAGMMFQSLQGTIQTSDAWRVQTRHDHVSIPSRYDPNLGKLLVITCIYKMFQSLQGTIQTYSDESLNLGRLIGFNPFKVRSKRG